MESEWPIVRLGELAKVKGGKRLPKGRMLAESKTAYPYIRVVDISDGRIDPSQLCYVPEDVFPKIERYTVNDGEVIISIVGTIGLIAIVPPNLHKANLTENAAKITINSDRIDSEFLSWYLKSPKGQHEIKRNTVGSTQPKLPLYGINDFLIPLPSIDEQRAIAHILGTLDDKIELNRRMNRTLEQMAQAIFKSWFVDFDPVVYNAVRAGNPVPERFAETAARYREHPEMQTLPEDVLALFPDRFVESDDYGEVPTEWEVKPFGEILSKTIGGDWGKEERDEKHTILSAIIRGTDIPELKSGTKGKTPLRWVEKKKFDKRKLQDGDIVIEISGGSPTTPTGRSILITNSIIERLGGVVEPASFCRLFRPKNKQLGLLATQHLTYIFYQGKTWQYQNQSTGISNFQAREFLEKELMPIPNSEQVLKVFFDICRPMLDYKHSNESIKLSEVRDILLSKLISGELGVPNEEKVKNNLME